MDTHFNALIFKSILTLKQSLCCDDGTTMGKCQWRGYRGVGLSCTSGCVDGETKIVENTNNHGKKDQTCNGGFKVIAVLASNRLQRKLNWKNRPQTLLKLPQRLKLPMLLSI